MKSTIFLLGLSLCLIAFVSSERTAVAFRDSLPQNWISLEDLPLPTESVTFTILLKQRNLDKLDQIFKQVSDPQDPSYGKFLSKEQLHALIRPSEDSFLRVIRWIQSFSQATFVEGVDHIKVSAPVQVAEEMLSTQLKRFKHIQNQKEIIRSYGQVSIPSEISTYVDFVAGITEFFEKPEISGKFAAEKENLATNPPNNKEIAVTPNVLRNYYGIPPAQSVKNSKNLQCIAAFNDWFSMEAFELFEKANKLPSIQITQIEKGTQAVDFIESDLDVQYISGVGRGAELFFVKQNGGYWILEFVTEFSALPKKPLVVSISYGWPELLQCQIATQNCATLGYNSTQYVDRTNTGFKIMGALGTSVMVTDGDTGAGNGMCGSDFRAIYPGSSPFVTSVGATRFLSHDGSNVYDEIAVSISNGMFWSTGGGFSSFQKAQSYQKTAVQNWYNLAKKDGKLPTHHFDTQFRGYPDVAFNGHNFQIYVANGQNQTCPCAVSPVDGTSASSPSFAGMVTLLNDVVLNAGKSPLGFLNPLLYEMSEKNPKSFRDITVGDNKWLCPDGYQAQKGWDPVGGLGSPVFPEILKYIQRVKKF